MLSARNRENNSLSIVTILNGKVEGLTQRLNPRGPRSCVSGRAHSANTQAGAQPPNDLTLPAEHRDGQSVSPFHTFKLLTLQSRPMRHLIHMAAAIQ